MFRPVFSCSTLEYGLLEAARTVETRDEARAVGVAEPVVDSDRGGGGGSRELVEEVSGPLVRAEGWRRMALGVPLGVAGSGGFSGLLSSLEV